MIRIALLIVTNLLAQLCPLTASGNEVYTQARRTRTSMAIITATISCSNGIGASAACRLLILSQTNLEAFVEPNRALDGKKQENTSAMPQICRLELAAPVAMKIQDLGGIGLRSLVRGRSPKDTVGANNLGLMVRICGRITSVGKDYIYIDDGSALIDGTFLNGKRNTGVRVICRNASDWKLDDYVSVTGISSYFETADGGLARCVRTRSPEDILLISTQVLHQP
jgi:hypothetical protein